MKRHLFIPAVVTLVAVAGVAVCLASPGPIPLSDDDLHSIRGGADCQEETEVSNDCTECVAVGDPWNPTWEKCVEEANARACVLYEGPFMMRCTPTLPFCGGNKYSYSDEMDCLAEQNHTGGGTCTRKYPDVMVDSDLSPSCSPE